MDINHINELLSYAVFYMNNSCSDNIKKVINSFYTPEEILNAKKLLWNMCSDELPTYTERRDTEKRSGSDANVSDILEGIIKLDNIEKLPNFVAKQIDRLPKRGPEELNIVSIINRLGNIENRINEYDNVLSSHEIDLHYLKSLEIGYKLKSLSDNLDNIKINNNVFIPPPEKFSDEDSMNKTKEDDASTNEENLNDSDWETVEDEVENSSANEKLSYKDATLKFINNKSRKEFKKDKKVKSTVISCSPEPKRICISTINDDGYQNVESRQQRRRRLYKNNLLQGAPPPMKSIFVSRVKKFCNVLTMKNFLNDNDIYYDDVSLVSHDNSKFNSFKININKIDISKVMQSHFWPIGVKCNMWKEKSKSNVQYYNSRFVDNHLLS